MQSSGRQMLDDAALAAAFENKYSPGTRYGEPILVWVTYKVEFSPDD